MTAPHRRAPEPHETGPVGGHLVHVVRGLIVRFRIKSLEQRHGSTIVLAIFSLVNGFISIALMSLVALAIHQPFVFPSLGPTAFVFFAVRSRPQRALAMRWSAISSAPLPVG